MLQDPLRSRRKTVNPSIDPVHIGILAEHRDEIVGALDMLFQGF